ncbi:hypothetical protein BH24CHL4_BH24CHL4_25760 [soil metagenome]
MAEVPGLPGCVTQGRTCDKALTNIREAIMGYIETLIENGDPIPEDIPTATLVVV